MENPGERVRDILEHENRLRATWFSDAAALTSHCNKDCGQVANKQLRVVIASIREALEDKLNRLKWCDTTVQLADCLTKLECERGIAREVMSGKPTPTEPNKDGIDRKIAIREGRHRRAAEAKALKSEQCSAVPASGEEAD